MSRSPRKWKDSFPPPLLRKVPRSKALVPRNTGCPLSLKLSNMCSATSSHSPFGLYVFDPYHFFSDPGPRNDHCPCGNIRAYPATVVDFATHISLFSLLPHEISLNIDRKMIRPVNCSGPHFISVIMFWMSARICNVVNPVKFVHSNSIGSPSIRSNSRHWGYL